MHVFSPHHTYLQHASPEHQSAHPVGLSGLIGVIGGAAARQRLHALHPAGPGQQAAATGFALALTLSLEAADSAAPVLWVQTREAVIESGRPYGLGLSELGLDPGRLVVVQVASAMDAFAAAEMGLEETGLAGVLVDLPRRLPAGMMKLGKRLSLRAETRRTPCFLLHARPEPVEAPVATRWTVSSGQIAQGRAPFPDFTTRFELALTKNRFGALGRWSVAWRAGGAARPKDVSSVVASRSVALVAPPLSRDRHGSRLPPSHTSSHSQSCRFQSCRFQSCRFGFVDLTPAASERLVSNTADRPVGTPRGAQPVPLRPAAA